MPVSQQAQNESIPSQEKYTVLSSFPHLLLVIFPCVQTVGLAEVIQQTLSGLIKAIVGRNARGGSSSVEVLHQILQALCNTIDAVTAYVDTLEGDEKTGGRIIQRALEEPVRQIAENAGFEGSVVVAEVKRQPVGVGFNAATEEYVDMIEAGIVDPAKVTRSALQNAASASAMLLTTEAGIVDIKEETPAMPAPPMGGGMGGMM